MSATNVIISVIIIALIVAGGAYYMGYFDEGEVVIEDAEQQVAD
jgi:hypothetical protein